jgi:hypothetical protein
MRLVLVDRHRLLEDWINDPLCLFNVALTSKEGSIAHHGIGEYPLIRGHLAGTWIAAGYQLYVCTWPSFNERCYGNGHGRGDFRAQAEPGRDAMKLREGIEIYIEARQSEGLLWAKGAQNLRCLAQQIGDVALESIRVNHVAAFLDGPLTSPMSWYKKYSLMRGFFRYWKARNELSSLPVPPPRRSPVQTFVPCAYSRTEIRRLLVAAGTVAEKICAEK